MMALLKLLLLGVAGARERGKEREREKERGKRLILIWTSIWPLSLNIHNVTSTLSFPCGDAYFDLFPFPCCSQQTTLAYYSTQIYKTFHLIRRDLSSTLAIKHSCTY
jgi:hypothetical protein